MRFDLEQRVFVEHSDDPEAPAIVDGSGVLSWGEFQSAVQNWVERAKIAGVSSDIPLVIYGHKEANYFIAMTGCLVIGAPFVPVDTIYPAERYERIRKISG